MKNLNKAKTELENEFGRKLSETEKRVMERISGVEEEMRKEVKRLNDKIDGVSSFVYRLNQQVQEHLHPQKPPKRDWYPSFPEASGSIVEFDEDLNRI